MIENSGNSVIFYAHYTTDGVSTASLTVTIDIYEVIRDGTATLVVNDGSCTDVGAGIYRYLLASGTVDAAAEYIGVFHTATDTVDAQDIPAMWVIDRAGTEKLDTGITLADDAITAAALKADAVTKIQNGLATAAALDAVDNFIDTEVAAILADTNEIQAELADGGRTDLLIDAIKAKTDLIPATPAQAGEYTAAIAAIPTAPLLAANYTAPDNTSIAAIKEKTDNLPASPAPANEYDTELTAIQTDLDNPDQYKADVSTLATTAHVQEVEDKVDIVDGIADAILDDTGTSGVLLSTSALRSIFDDEVIVGTYTFSDLLKIMAAALAGKLSGGGSTTLKFEGVDGASDVIVTTVDANKNRTNVVITV